MTFHYLMTSQTIVVEFVGMKIRIGPYAAGAWIISVWLVLAFWIGSLLRIPSGWLWWIYIALNAIPLRFVDRKLEDRINRGWLQDGVKIRMKITPKRLLVVLLVAVLWCVEYLAILLYAPHLIVGSSPIVTISLFWILPLIVATILEISWMKQDAR